MTRDQYSVDTSRPAVVRKFDPSLTRRARPPPVHPARLGHAPDADPARPPGPTSAPSLSLIQEDQRYRRYISRNPENSISWQHRYGSRKNPWSRTIKNSGTHGNSGAICYFPRAARQVPAVGRIDPGSPAGMTLPRRAGETGPGPRGHGETSGHSEV